MVVVQVPVAALFFSSGTNWNHYRMAMARCALMSFRGSIQHFSTGTLALRGEQQGRKQDAVSPNMALEDKACGGADVNKAMNSGAAPAIVGVEKGH